MAAPFPEAANCTDLYPVETPQRPLLGSMQQAFYGGQSPWQYEALFVSRAKSVVKAEPQPASPYYYNSELLCCVRRGCVT
jgi:hypothetical protein